LAFEHVRDGGQKFAQHGVPVLLDAEKAKHLTGCLLDYADGLDASGFQIDNAATTCGCGKSFGV
jgi:Fe-S cluster assembly iron-binding protein IscA